MRAFHFIDLKYGLQALRDHRLKVATLNELNDPFRLVAADLSEKSARQRFKIWKREVSESTGLHCFSKRWRNPLLWSHYADRHRGVALTLDIQDDAVIPVRYSGERISLDFSAIRERGEFDEELAECPDATKAHHWGYEDEVRVSVSLSQRIANENLYFEPLSDGLKISGVVLGPLCTVSDQDIQKAVPAGMAISLSRARLAFGSFGVVKNRAIAKKRIRGIEG